MNYNGESRDEGEHVTCPDDLIKDWVDLDDYDPAIEETWKEETA